MKPVTQDGDERLVMLKPDDICIQESVQDYLSSHANLKALVAVGGNCFVVPSPKQKRVILGLTEVVKRVEGCANQIPISWPALERWATENRPKTTALPATGYIEVNVKVQSILQGAIAAKASDIYLDIGRQSARLSFRTWGCKRFVDEFPREVGLALARSMWAITNTGHFEENAPCDCSFSIDYQGREYRVRGNSLPDVRGPNIVCRLRDPKYVLPLIECGYNANQAHLINRICMAPGGLILVTGETNSGKSTTLAAMMQSLPTTQKIIEVADPVEIVLPHITHVELNRYHSAAKDMYARIQAAIVRQNPDTLILGEIRDEVTAKAAVTMAMQGKRVYSTLHTQSCLTALPRLESLGVDRDLLSLRGFLTGVVSQNLVPLVCQNCARKNTEGDSRYKKLFGTGVRYLNAQGCHLCLGGIVGQTLVAEIYPFCLDRSGKTQELVRDRNFMQLERHMKSLWGTQSKHQHAATKITKGLIDPKETERIIGEFCAEELQELAGVRN